MLEHQEKVAFLILVGITVAVISANAVLGFVGKQPFARPFSEKVPDGELVIVEGNISQVSITHSGGNMVLLVDNVSIFVPSQVASGMSIEKGDPVKVIGTVQTYQGDKEIVVGSANDLKILK